MNIMILFTETYLTKLDLEKDFLRYISETLRKCLRSIRTQMYNLKRIRKRLGEKYEKQVFI